MTTETPTGEPTTEEILAQMMAASPAPEPGSAGRNDVIHRGDDDLPAPMRIGALSSAGYVEVWDTRTRERSVVNRNLLPTQLKKLRPDKTRVFTTVKPTEPPARGALKCPLHPEGPHRTEYDVLGLPTCGKANLTSPYQVRRHMEKRHPTSWATLEEERVRVEREADRDLQRQIIALAGRPQAERGKTA